MMVDDETLARDYVYKTVSKTLVFPPSGGAYQWIINEVAYYTKPTYINTNYTNEVLKVLNELVGFTDSQERYEEKDFVLMFFCKL